VYPYKEVKNHLFVLAMKKENASAGMLNAGIHHY
jgi:hypothetical protein